MASAAGVFSPNLARRLSLGSYAAWRWWIALEANPEATSHAYRNCSGSQKTSIYMKVAALLLFKTANQELTFAFGIEKSKSASMMPCVARLLLI